MEELSHVGMTNCYFCGQGKDILLDKSLRKSLPRFVGVVDMEPCNECKGWMEKGVVIISISDNTTDEEMKNNPPTPYRTGGWTVLKDEAIEKMPIPKEMKEWALKHRFLYLTDAVWDHFGIPRGDQNGEEKSD